MKLNNEQIQDVILKYLSGKYSFRMLAKIFLVDKGTISNIIHKNNIKLQKISLDTRKYTLNEHYFDNIDSEHKAYWLGWLYSDGCNLENSGTLKISIQEGDKEILEKFSDDLETNRPLYFYDKSKIKPNEKNVSTIVIRSKHMSQRLKELGCMARKSLIIEFPTEDQVPTHLINHFLRGVWDGDGSYVCDKVKDNFYFNCNLASTINFCEKVQSLLINNLNIFSKIYSVSPKHNTVSKQLHITGRNNIIKFINWIYNNSTIYLNRKFLKTREMLELYKNRYASNYKEER